MPKRIAKKGAGKKLAIAFRAYKEGIYRREYSGKRGETLWNTRTKEYKDGKEVEIFIKRKEIKSYMDEYFFSAINVYGMTETMKCLPFSGGWAEQPFELTAIIALFRAEQNKWEQEEFERKYKT